MTPAGMIGYFSLGALLAAPAAAAVLLVLRGAGARPTPARAACAYGAALVVVLALYPLPDPALFDCARDAKRANLTPFAFLGAARTLLAAGAPAMAWLGDVALVSSVMNLALFLAPGAALAWVAREQAPAAAGRPPGWVRLGPLAGLALSGLIETAQATGLGGLYDCAYRRFDVDDLMLNTLGFALGFCLARRAGARVTP